MPLYMATCKSGKRDIWLQHVKTRVRVFTLSQQWTINTLRRLMQAHLSAAVTTSNEGTIRVLASTLASLGVLDTTRAIPAILSPVAPIEDPVIRILLQLVTGRGIAGISAACAVGSAVVRIILVVGFKDGEGLGL